MSKHTSVSIKKEALAKLRVLRAEYVRMAQDAAYKRLVIEQARAKDGEQEWAQLKAETRALRSQRSLF